MGPVGPKPRVHHDLDGVGGAPISPLRGADPDGHLATGWEAHRLLSDGLLRRFVHAYASSFVGPVALMGGRIVRREPYVIWDRGRAAGLYNGAMLLQPLPHDGWERTVDDVEVALSAGA